MAFDTLHMLRTATPLPPTKVKMLAALLDLAACANAALDKKKCCPYECRRTLQLVEEAGLRLSVVDYLRRLRDLESKRPLPGGDDRRFRRARAYRESVVRLSLGFVTTTALEGRSLDEGIRATHRDPDLNFLFRIIMQCQIIDDVLDYSRDLAAGLPSFLTASKSPSQAFELTRLAAVGYADDRTVPQSGNAFPLRAALLLVSTCARLVIVLGRWTSGG